MNNLFRTTLPTVLALCAAGLAGSLPAPNPDANQLLDQFRQAYLARDAEKLLALYADDATFEDVIQQKTHQGKEALRESFTQLLAVHTQIGLEDLRRVVSGNQAVWEVRYSGAIAGDMLGAAEDQEYSIRAVLLFRFENGKIRSQTDYLDVISLKKQLKLP